MTLVVEDGTGKTDANAFASLAYCKTYWTGRARTHDTFSDAVLEAAIIRATDHLSDGYRWRGYKLKERGHPDGEQALAWPRSYVWDRNGYSVAQDEVPAEIQKATAEIALYEAGSPNAMQPIYNPHGRVKSERVGELAVTYDMSRTDADGARPVLLAVRDLVSEFLEPGAGSMLSGGSFRA